MFSSLGGVLGGAGGGGYSASSSATARQDQTSSFGTTFGDRNFGAGSGSGGFNPITLGILAAVALGALFILKRH